MHFLIVSSNANRNDRKTYIVPFPLQKSPAIFAIFFWHVDEWKCRVKIYFFSSRHIITGILQYVVPKRASNQAARTSYLSRIQSMRPKLIETRSFFINCSTSSNIVNSRLYYKLYILSSNLSLLKIHTQSLI